MPSFAFAMIATSNCRVLFTKKIIILHYTCLPNECVHASIIRDIYFCSLLGLTSSEHLGSTSSFGPILFLGEDKLH